MPVNCEYQVDKAVLYCTAEGSVTVEDFQQAMAGIINSNEFSPDVRTLWDIRKLDYTSVTRELADKLISLREKNPQRGNTKIVIIADKNHNFGMSRMYEMLSGELPQQIMVFREFEEGEKWLME